MPPPPPYAQQKPPGASSAPVAAAPDGAAAHGPTKRGKKGVSGYGPEDAAVFVGLADRARKEAAQLRAELARIVADVARARRDSVRASKRAARVMDEAAAMIEAAAKVAKEQGKRKRVARQKQGAIGKAQEQEGGALLPAGWEPEVAVWWGGERGTGEFLRLVRSAKDGGAFVVAGRGITRRGRHTVGDYGDEERWDDVALTNEREGRRAGTEEEDEEVGKIGERKLRRKVLRLHGVRGGEEGSEEEQKEDEVFTEDDEEEDEEEEDEVEEEEEEEQQPFGTLKRTLSKPRIPRSPSTSSASSHPPAAAVLPSAPSLTPPPQAAPFGTLFPRMEKPARPSPLGRSMTASQTIGDEAAAYVSSLQQISLRSQAPGAETTSAMMGGGPRTAGGLGSYTAGSRLPPQSHGHIPLSPHLTPTPPPGRPPSGLQPIPPPGKRTSLSPLHGRRLSVGSAELTNLAEGRGAMPGGGEQVTPPPVAAMQRLEAAKAMGLLSTEGVLAPSPPQETGAPPVTPPPASGPGSGRPGGRRGRGGQHSKEHATKAEDGMTEGQGLAETSAGGGIGAGQQVPLQVLEDKLSRRWGEGGTALLRHSSVDPTALNRIAALGAAAGIPPGQPVSAALMAPLKARVPWLPDTDPELAKLPANAGQHGPLEALGRQPSLLTERELTSFVKGENPRLATALSGLAGLNGLMGGVNSALTGILNRETGAYLSGGAPMGGIGRMGAGPPSASMVPGVAGAFNRLPPPAYPLARTSSLSAVTSKVQQHLQSHQQAMKAALAEQTNRGAHKDETAGGSADQGQSSAQGGGHGGKGTERGGGMQQSDREGGTSGGDVSATDDENALERYRQKGLETSTSEGETTDYDYDTEKEEQKRRERQERLWKLEKRVEVDEIDSEQELQMRREERKMDKQQDREMKLAAAAAAAAASAIHMDGGSSSSHAISRLVVDPELAARPPTKSPQHRFNKNRGGTKWRGGARDKAAEVVPGEYVGVSGMVLGELTETEWEGEDSEGDGQDSDAPGGRGVRSTVPLRVRVGADLEGLQEAEEDADEEEAVDADGRPMSPSTRENRRNTGAQATTGGSSSSGSSGRTGDGATGGGGGGARGGGELERGVSGSGSATKFGGALPLLSQVSLNRTGTPSTSALVSPPPVSGSPQSMSGIPIAGGAGTPGSLLSQSSIGRMGLLSGSPNTLVSQGSIGKIHLLPGSPSILIPQASIGQGHMLPGSPNTLLSQGSIGKMSLLPGSPNTLLSQGSIGKSGLFPSSPRTLLSQASLQPPGSPGALMPQTSLSKGLLLPVAPVAPKSGSPAPLGRRRSSLRVGEAVLGGGAAEGGGNTSPVPPGYPSPGFSGSPDKQPPRQPSDLTRKLSITKDDLLAALRPASGAMPLKSPSPPPPAASSALQRPGGAGPYSGAFEIPVSPLSRQVSTSLNLQKERERMLRELEDRDGEEEEEDEEEEEEEMSEGEGEEEYGDKGAVLRFVEGEFDDPSGGFVGGNMGSLGHLQGGAGVSGGGTSGGGATGGNSGGSMAEAPPQTWESPPPPVPTGMGASKLERSEQEMLKRGLNPLRVWLAEQKREEAALAAAAASAEAVGAAESEGGGGEGVGGVDEGEEGRVPLREEGMARASASADSYVGNELQKETYSSNTGTLNGPLTPPAAASPAPATLSRASSPRTEAVATAAAAAAAASLFGDTGAESSPLFSSSGGMKERAPPPPGAAQVPFAPVPVPPKGSPPGEGQRLGRRRSLSKSPRQGEGPAASLTSPGAEKEGGDLSPQLSAQSPLSVSFTPSPLSSSRGVGESEGGRQPSNNEGKQGPLRTLSRTISVDPFKLADVDLSAKNPSLVKRSSLMMKGEGAVDQAAFNTALDSFLQDNVGKV